MEPVELSFETFKISEMLSAEPLEDEETSAELVVATADSSVEVSSTDVDGEVDKLEDVEEAEEFERASLPVFSVLAQAARFSVRIRIRIEAAVFFIK